MLHEQVGRRFCIDDDLLRGQSRAASGAEHLLGLGMDGKGSPALVATIISRSIRRGIEGSHGWIRPGGFEDVEAPDMDPVESENYQPRQYGGEQVPEPEPEDNAVPINDRVLRADVP